MENNLILFCILSYLIGSIPFAYIITKIFGYGDIRKIGSGNIGATNVLRTGNKNLAASVLFFDMLKGFLPITLLNLFYQNIFESHEIFIIGCFTVIGHIFSIWLKFQGGKGVASYIGFMLGISFNLGFFFILIWLIIFIITRYSSLASILSLIAISIASIFIFNNINLIFLLIILNILIIIKHKSNIKRLLSNSENKINL